jgi:excisionase family DNA binding protein
LEWASRCKSFHSFPRAFDKNIPISNSTGRKTNDSVARELRLKFVMPTSKLTFREFLSRLHRVKPYSLTWALNDDGGLTIVDSVEHSGSTPDSQRASLIERIERTGHALTAKELSNLLNVSRITIFKHAAAGRIPAFRIGASVRFDPKTIADWLRKQ